MAILSVDRGGKYRVESLYQWDKNQKLEISGLTVPNTPEIHFVNKSMSEALVRQAKKDANGVIIVDIPNVILEKSLPIDVYICAYEDDLFSTLYALQIPVKARTKPSDYVYEKEDEILSFNALNNRLETTVGDAIASVNKKYNDTLEDLIRNNNETRQALTDAFNERVENLRNEVVGDDVVSLEEKVSNLIIVLNNISIPTSAWSTKTYTISSDKITANSIIDVYYSSTSKSIMSDAEPSYTVSAGKLVITVATVPTSTVVIDCIKVVNDV